MKKTEKIPVEFGGSRVLVSMSRFKKFALILAAFAFSSCALSGSSEAGAAEKVTIRFLDVGQGLAVLLESRGKFALYDTGPDSSDFAETLGAFGVDSLEWLVLGNFNREHAGGFTEFGAQSPKIKQLYVAPDTAAGDVRAAVTEVAEGLGLKADTLRRGDSLKFAGLSFTSLWPPTLGSYGGNSASVVLNAKVGDESLLLTGDIEAAEEAEILSLGSTFGGSLLQVANHGSSGSSSLSFLEVAAPSYAAIGVGEGNPGGLPEAQTLAKLYLVTGDSTSVFRTDQDGTICFEWQLGTGIWPCS